MSRASRAPRAPSAPAHATGMRCTSCTKPAGTAVRTCPTCAELHRDFQRVREHLYANGPASVGVVAEATGIDPARIAQMLAAGYLQDRPPAGAGPAMHRCEVCGGSAGARGTMCDDCRQRLLSPLTSRDLELAASDPERNQRRPALGRGGMRARRPA